MMDIQTLTDLDWSGWVLRWDRMQARYLAERDERFAIIARLVRDTQAPQARLLDLGCGTGSLLAVLLNAMPQAQGTGVDLDPTLLLLAGKRLASFGDRVQLIDSDLRKPSWLESLAGPFDAVVSATALHWLSPEQLSILYGQIARLLRPGGIFLNADHVASESSVVQKAWTQQRDFMRSVRTDPADDDWEGFWKAYLDSLGPDAAAFRKQALGDWQGVEDGQSLLWHFQHLAQAGLTATDCFWRLDCDAIYGGVLP